MSYNENLQSNNTELEAILQAIYNLPEAGSSGSAGSYTAGYEAGYAAGFAAAQAGNTTTAVLGKAKLGNMILGV